MAVSLSRGSLAQCDEIFSILRDSRPTLVGCLCGAAEQLDEERARIAAEDEGFVGRAERLIVCEEDLDLRTQQLDAGMQEALLGEQRLHEHEQTVESKAAELEDSLHEAAVQEDLLRAEEAELQKLAASTQSLERELHEEEIEFDAEEAALIGSRTAAQEKLQSL